MSYYRSHCCDKVGYLRIEKPGRLELQMLSYEDELQLSRGAADMQAPAARPDGYFLFTPVHADGELLEYFRRGHNLLHNAGLMLKLSLVHEQHRSRFTYESASRIIGAMSDGSVHTDISVEQCSLLAQAEELYSHRWRAARAGAYGRHLVSPWELRSLIRDLFPKSLQGRIVIRYADSRLAYC